MVRTLADDCLVELPLNLFIRCPKIVTALAFQGYNVEIQFQGDLETILKVQEYLMYIADGNAPFFQEEKAEVKMNDW